MTNSDVRADGARWAKDWLSGNPCEAQFLSGVGKWAVEFAVAAYAAGRANPSPPAMDREAVLWVSPGQLAAIEMDRSGEGGTYLPARKTPKGNFTMPLYIALAGTGGRVPDDVRRLVIAARNVAYADPVEPDELGELDRAAEAFASRVPWDNEPTPTSPDESRSAEGEALVPVEPTEAEIKRVARAMCDRVNGQGDYDENPVRHTGWDAQARTAIAALRTHRGGEK